MHDMSDNPLRIRKQPSNCEIPVNARHRAEKLGAGAILTRMQEFTGEGPQMDDISLIAIERKK